MSVNIVGGMTKSSNTTKTPTVAELILAKNDFFKTYFEKEQSRLIAIETATAIGSDPKFKNCTPESIVRAIMDAVRIGFPISTAVSYFYLVAYKDKVQLQISAKGFTQLLYRAGWLISCEPIYSCDSFSEKITENGKQIELTPNYDDREEDDKEWVYKNLQKVLVVAINAQGMKIHKVVTRKTIEKLRLTSPGQVYANQYTSAENRKRIAEKLPVDIWYEWYEEMAFAKAIKKAAKLIPHGDILLEKALRLDSLASIGEEAEYVSVSESLNEVETLPKVIEPSKEESTDTPPPPQQSQQPKAPEKTTVEKQVETKKEPVVDVKTVNTTEQETIDSMFELNDTLEMLGFKITAVAENSKGQKWAQIVATEEDADFDSVFTIKGVKKIPDNNEYLVMNVTELQGA